MPNCHRWITENFERSSLLKIQTNSDNSLKLSCNSLIQVKNCDCYLSVYRVRPLNKNEFEKKDVNTVQFPGDGVLWVRYSITPCLLCLSYRNPKACIVYKSEQQKTSVFWFTGIKGSFNWQWPKSFTDRKFPIVVKTHQETIPLNEQFGRNLM